MRVRGLLVLGRARVHPRLSDLGAGSRRRPRPRPQPRSRSRGRPRPPGRVVKVPSGHRRLHRPHLRPLRSREEVHDWGRRPGPHARERVPQPLQADGAVRGRGTHRDHHLEGQVIEDDEPSTSLSLLTNYTSTFFFPNSQICCVDDSEGRPRVRRGGGEDDRPGQVPAGTSGSKQGGKRRGSGWRSRREEGARGAPAEGSRRRALQDSMVRVLSKLTREHLLRFFFFFLCTGLTSSTCLSPCATWSRCVSFGGGIPTRQRPRDSRNTLWKYQSTRRTGRATSRTKKSMFMSIVLSFPRQVLRCRGVLGVWRGTFRERRPAGAADGAEGVPFYVFVFLAVIGGPWWGAQATGAGGGTGRGQRGVQRDIHW